MYSTALWRRNGDAMRNRKSISNLRACLRNAVWEPLTAMLRTARHRVITLIIPIYTNALPDAEFRS